MLKYLIRVFNPDDTLLLQVVVPADNLWDSLENAHTLGTVKAVILDEE